MIFGHDPLEAAGILVVILGTIAVGWAVWRAKSAEVGAAAADTWKLLAEGYQEKLEQRDEQIVQLRVDHAAETEGLRTEIAELRRRINDLQSRDQRSVLEWGRQHEANAAERHTRLLDVLVEIRDTLKEGATP